MIITCPACAAKFNLDNALMPQGGRKLRCGKCGHVFQAKPPGAPVTEPAKLRPIPEAIRPAPSAPPQAAPAPQAAPMRAASPEKPAAEKPAGARTLHLGKAILVVLCMLAAMLAGLFLLRDLVVQAFPPAEDIYNDMGLSTGPAWKGLKIAGVSASGVKEPAGASITVSGEVVNHSSRPVMRPHLVGTISGGVAPTAFSIDMQPGVIAPGGREAFSRTLHGLPVDSSSVDITFAP